MMADALPALSAADLNTTINHEPRVLDLAVAERLGMADVHKIRPLINANRTELEAYGEISARRAENADPKGRGRPGREFWLNEGQALVICALSRTPAAAKVRKAIIDVFMAYRRGQLVEAAKPVTVRQHRRSRPRALPTPAAVDPAPFSAGSDFLRDLGSLLASAEKRLSLGEAVDPIVAMQAVVADVLGRRGDPAHKAVGSLDDWNWQRRGVRYLNNPYAGGVGH